MKKQNKRLWATKVEELLVFHWIWLDLFDSKWNYCFNFLMLFNFPFNFLYKIHSRPTKILTSLPLLQQTQNFHRKLCLFLICHSRTSLWNFLHFMNIHLPSIFIHKVMYYIYTPLFLAFSFNISWSLFSYKCTKSFLTD